MVLRLVLDEKQHEVQTAENQHFTKEKHKS